MRHIPFILTPAAKDFLWGGNRLNEEYHKNIPVSPLAETWECSTHPDGLSYVSSLQCTLADLLKEHPEWLGTCPLQLTNGKPELPILIKLIDAKKDLSVQVHPDDEYALSHEGQPGKTEMWYVLDAEPGASLVYGFSKDTDESEVRKALGSGTLEKLLNSVPVRKDDLFFIEAGTVHAIGAGVLVAEVQENSNVTYRLYDYDRVGKDGKKRPLHIDKAMEVAKFRSSSISHQDIRADKCVDGAITKSLVRCKYFQVDRITINTEVTGNMVEYKTDCRSFNALLAADGCGTILGDGLSIPFVKGDCIFVPADSIPLKLHGISKLLKVSC